jgi:receptor protein-tyrosine kinase
VSDNDRPSSRIFGRTRSSSVEKAAARLNQLGAGISLAPAAAELESAAAARTVGLPPAAAPDAADHSNSRRTSRRVAINLETMRAAGMVTVSSERSVIAEEFRLIKRPLLVKAFADGPDKTHHGNLILITSARPGEGKTFCAVNLAMSIALERDLTVMLIDADIARPSVATTLGIEAEVGLTDLIADASLDPADVLLRTDLERLTVLPAGRPDPLATELLASDRMVRFVAEIAERYPDRVVIFDSPPVLMSTIPAVLAPYVGQIVFVVQAEASTQASIDAALGLISGCDNISLLLNKARDLGGAERFGAYYGYER